MSKKKKQCNFIKDNYNEYSTHLGATKTVAPVFTISKPKANHPQSYSGTMDVDCEHRFGTTSISCEIREGSYTNFSFTYLSDSFDKKVLARFDAGNGTHRNNAPGIPLEFSSVPTPHIHKYREDGYLLAYPLEGKYVTTEATEFDIYAGYSYFCKSLNITDENGNLPEIRFAPEGILPLDNDTTDPNEGIQFPIND